MAASELNAWTTYLERRQGEIDTLAEEKAKLEADIGFLEDHSDTRLYFSHKTDERTLALLREFFDRFKVITLINC